MIAEYREMVKGEVIIIKKRIDLIKMGGGHGPHIAYNENNKKESDEDMRGKIQRVDLVKFNPQNFHMEFFDVNNMYQILGGAPTCIMGALGAAGSVMYY